LTFPTPGRDFVRHAGLSGITRQIIVCGISCLSRPTTAPTALTMGVEYSLVSVVYLILGGCHYVTQFRLRGKWLKYDCTAGGSTSASASFDRRWHCGRQVLYVYVKTDLLVVSADSTVEPSGDSPGDSSGLSSAFLRALANVERRVMSTRMY